MTGWISVKDRLPDEENAFLVHLEGGYGMEAANFDFYGTKEFQRTDDNGYEYKVYADYWMPLPEPPKEGLDEREEET